MEEEFGALGDVFPALSRNARKTKRDRMEAQSADEERCELFIDEACADVRNLSEKFGTGVDCRCLRELDAGKKPVEDDGLTAAMRQMTFDRYVPRTPSQEQALAICRASTDWYRMETPIRPWIVMHGPPGVGKTHLAVGIMEEVPGGQFVSWPFILDELRSVASRPDEPYPLHIWDRLYRLGLLVIDDFDKDIDSVWARRQLYQVVNHRYSLRLPTIWTANMQLDKSEGPVGSRLRDKAVCQVLQITGPDHRIQGGR